MRRFNPWALLTAALVAAAPAGAGEPVKNPDTFVYLNQTGPTSFDPHWAQDNVSNSVNANVYETLLTFNGAGVGAKDLAPLLADRVPTRANKLISPDGLVYRFPIRKGVKFQDGTVLEPEDVRYSLLRLLLMDRAGGPSSVLLQPILGLDSTRRDGKPIDDLYERAAKAVRVEEGQVVIRLHKPFSPLLSILTGVGSVLPRRWCAARGQWDGASDSWKQHNNAALQSALSNAESNGTGPFKIERSDTDSVYLTRHDAYWRGPARLKRVLIKTVPEFLTRRLMLQAGDADAISAPTSVYSQLERLPGVRLLTVDALLSPVRLTLPSVLNPVGNSFVGSGLFDGEGIPPDFFADKDLRRAFAYSIDQKTFIRDVLKGLGKPAAGVVPPGVIGHRAGAPRYAYDRRKAEDHFRKAWGGKVWDKGFLFTFICREGNMSDLALGQMLKKELASINPKFRIDTRNLQFSTILEADRKGMTPPHLRGWRMGYPDPHDLFFYIYHTQADFAPYSYSNVEVDRLIAAAALEPEPARREEQYSRIQDIIDEDLPETYIWAGPDLRVMREWVKGYVFRPTLTAFYFHDLYK